MVPIVLLRNRQGHTWLQENSSLNMEGKAPRCKVSDTENERLKYLSLFYSSRTGLSSFASTLLWVPTGMDWWVPNAEKLCEKARIAECLVLWDPTVWDGARGPPGTSKLLIFTRACLRESGTSSRIFKREVGILLLKRILTTRHSGHCGIKLSLNCSFLNYLKL